MERLELLGTFVRDVPKFGKPPSTTELEKNKQRSQAALDILHIAHVGRVRAGKARSQFINVNTVTNFVLAVDAVLRRIGGE